MKKLSVLLVAFVFALSFGVISSSYAAEGSHGMMENKESVAIKGFCPVCVINGMKVKGSDHFVTEYKGKVYQFASIDQQKMFLEDPEKYVADLDAKFNALKDDGMMKKDDTMMPEGSH